MSVPWCGMDLVPALDEPLKKVLGPPTAKVMAEHLGLHTVGDLLHHYPRRYEERGQLTHLADLPMDEHVTVVAMVADARLHSFASAKAPRGKGQRLEVTITDGSGRLQLVFFGNGVHKPHKELLPGTRAMFAGKVSVFNRRLQLAHPAYELLRDDSEEAVESWAGALIPLYPATAKLESWKIGKAIQTVLPSAQEAVDPLPGVPARRPRPGPPSRGPAQDPPPAHQGRHRGRPRPPQVGRGLRPPGRARPPPARRRPTPRRRPPPRARRTPHRLRRPPPLHPHRGPAAGLPRDLRRPGHRAPDAPAPPGRGR
ncbi:hypothetical protein RKD41_005115 [Streptomyces tendae]